jgi:WhiB family redox-sensing transcriptional regulator
MKHDGTWIQFGACRGIPTDIFMPKEDGRTPNYNRARRVCSVCPVVEECLNYALACGKDTVGYWGNTTQRERLDILAGRNRRPKKIVHGTLSGFYSERKGDGTPCAACRQAYLEFRNNKEGLEAIPLKNLITLSKVASDDSSGT